MAAPNAPNTLKGNVISLRLLDAVQGHAVQTWNFENSATVQIGRLEENDVVLNDPLVSRMHATLKQVNGQWELISLGKHGVLINDQRVENATLKHETVFRLGSKGPLLMFVELDRAPPKESQTYRSTVEIDSRMIESLGIDQDRAQEQIKELTDNESFERLREKAREMREKRSSNSA